MKKIKTIRYKKSWGPIGSYQDEELMVVEFQSVAERNRAIDLIYGVADLLGLPWDSPNGMDMFVPRESVPALRAKGLRFTTSELLSDEELSPDELARLRDQYCM